MAEIGIAVGPVKIEKINERCKKKKKKDIMKVSFH